MTSPPPAQNPDFLARATLARAFMGEPARLDWIGSGLFSPTLGAIWRAAKDDLEAHDTLDVSRLLAVPGLDLKLLGSIVGHPDRHLLPSAEAGVAQLAALTDQRHALKLAEQALEGVRAGNGAAQARALADWLAREHVPSALPAVPALDIPLELGRPCEPIPWLLAPRIGRGDAVVLAGNAGSGKSIIALDTALGLATGTESALGLGPGQPVRVAYFDAEMSRQLALHRLRRQTVGRRLVAEDFHEIPLHYYPTVSLDLNADPDLDTFRRTIAAVEPEVVVLDSLIRFVGRAEIDRDNTAIARFFARVVAPLTDQGVTVVILHHLRKPSGGKDAPEDAQARVRGGSDLVAAVSAVVLVERLLGGSTRALTQTKCRWQTEPPPHRVEFEGDAGDPFLRIRTAGVPLDAEALILNALGDAGRAGKLRLELVAILEDAGSADAQNTAKITLGRLKSRGRIYTRPEGRAARYWTRDFAPSELLATS